MKPFVCGERRYAFDITNADDMRRLEGAFAQLCARADALPSVESEGAGNASARLSALFDAYCAFFEAVFPTRGREIVGNELSAGHAARIFDRFCTYLRDGLQEEKRIDDAVRRMYLGERTDGDA